MRAKGSCPDLAPPRSSGDPQGLGRKLPWRGREPLAAHLTALGCPWGSGGWTSGQRGLREKTVVREREEVVGKRFGAGRAGVPWVWDPISSHHSGLLTRGWEGGGERWGAGLCGEGHPGPELGGAWAESLRIQAPPASPRPHHPPERSPLRVRAGPPRGRESGGGRRGDSFLGSGQAHASPQDIVLPAKACHLPLLPPPKTGGRGLPPPPSLREPRTLWVVPGAGWRL